MIKYPNPFFNVVVFILPDIHTPGSIPAMAMLEKMKRPLHSEFSLIPSEKNPHQVLIK